MALIDVKKLEQDARRELSEEATDTAKERLKGLFSQREKAQLALKNIDRQIKAYLDEVSELATYEAAGVDVG